jgi:hypothetical protein
MLHDGKLHNWCCSLYIINIVKSRMRCGISGQMGNVYNNFNTKYGSEVYNLENLGADKTVTLKRICKN